MIPELKEDVTHGTKQYPYDQYYLRDIPHAFQIPVHWHEEMEIIYIKEGTLHVRIEGRDYEGKKNDMFFVNPRELHLMGSQDTGVRYYTLLFPLLFLSFQSMDDLERNLFLPLRQGQLLFPAKGSDCKCEQEIRRLLDEVIMVNDKNKKRSQTEEMQRQIQTRILLLEMVQYIAKEDGFLLPEQGRSTNMQREMLDYIQNHFTEKLTLEDLAEEFHLSPKYISRYFKQHFSLAFSSYVIHLRLSCAKNLLETTENSVTEIALLSGFPNVSHFIRSFRQAYEISPLQYRKKKADV